METIKESQTIVVSGGQNCFCTNSKGEVEFVGAFFALRQDCKYECCIKRQGNKSYTSYGQTINC